MSKLTEDVDLVSLQEKRDRIVRIHRRLHSGNVKLEEPVDVQTNFYQETQQTNTPRLRRTDVRKILGDPLPLPYLIDSRQSRQSSSNSSSVAGPQLIKRRKTSLPTEAHLRLQNSIRNLQKIAADPVVGTQGLEFTPDVPTIETPVLRRRSNFKTPSPAESFRRRIVDSETKDQVLREFRGETVSKAQTACGELSIVSILSIVLFAGMILTIYILYSQGLHNGQ